MFLVACSVLLLNNCINAAEIISRPIKRSSLHQPIFQPNSTHCAQSSFHYFPPEIENKIIRPLCNIPETTPIKITVEDSTGSLVNLLQKGIMTLEIVATLTTSCVLTGIGICCCCARKNPYWAEYMSITKNQYKHKKE